MKKIKKIIIAIAICALIISLIPIPSFLKDGGTVRFDAVLYSVVFWHVLDGPSFDEYRNDSEYSVYYDDGYWVRTRFYFLPGDRDELSVFD